MWQCQACNLDMQVAEAALCVLHTLLIRIRVRVDTKRVLCQAVVAADLHQPLLTLLHIHPTSIDSSKVPPPLVLVPFTSCIVFLPNSCLQGSQQSGDVLC